jgi:hypothetical protein
MERSLLHSRAAIFAAGLLLAANVVVPLVWGDVYPFTSAPMFRDCPSQCCDYCVIAGSRELPAEKWLVQRVYDGNPVGYGVGVRPPAVIEQEFGVVHEDQAVRKHIEQCLGAPEHQSHESVEVIRRIVGPVDGYHVGVVRTDRWRIDRDR